MLTASLFQYACSIIILALGYLAIRADSRDLKNRSFFFLCVAISGWTISGLVMEHEIARGMSPLIVSRISMCFASFGAASFIYFSVSFLPKTARRTAIIHGAYTLAFVSTGLALGGFYIKSIAVVNGVAVRDFNTAFLFFVLYFFAAIGYSIYNLIKSFLHAVSSLERLRMRYILFGLTFGFTLASFFCIFLPMLGFNDLFFAGQIAPVLIAASSAYAIIKYRLLDVRVVVTRAGLMLTLYTPVLGIPFFIGYHTHSWVLSTSFAVVFASLGPILYRSLQEKAENIVLSEQRRYQKILLQAANGMAKEHNLDRLLKLIVYIVKRTVKIDFAAIFFDDKEKGVYRLMAVREMNPAVEGASFAYDHPFIAFLKQRSAPFHFAELPPSLKENFPFPLPVSLIVPSFYEERSTGFMLLGEKLNGKVYSSDDINVFDILSRQSALAVENCIFMIEFKKAQERLFTAEKLASIGGMADGVAHQIKNRLHQFSVTAGEQRFEIDDFIRDHPELIDANPDLRKSLDYLRHIADSLLDNVKKTAGIIQGILNFARVEEKSSFFSEFSLLEALRPSRDLLCIKHQLAEFPLTVEVNGPDVVYGVKAQIMESIYNLLDNGYEAICEKLSYHLGEDEKKTFVPGITLRLTQKENVSLIEIADNGIGIKEEHRHKMFAPFFTTKASSKSGTGIGMYVVKRMIEENHHGKIRFESEYTRGTKIFLEIPRPAKAAGRAVVGKTP